MHTEINTLLFGLYLNDLDTNVAGMISKFPDEIVQLIVRIVMGWAG